MGETKLRRTTKRPAALTLCLFLCLPLSGLRAAAQQAGDDKSPLRRNELLSVGADAPGWTLVDPSGRKHTLGDYRGKVVVLDFWATWCGPCAQLMPRMQKLHEKYGDRGVVVFGVNAWERADPAAAMGEKRLTYGLLLGGEQIARPYGIINLPVVYVIGVDGKVIHRSEGVDDKNLGKLIEKHLKERGLWTSQ